MPATYIRDYYVQLAKDDKNMIEGWVQLEGSDKEQKKDQNNKHDGRPSRRGQNSQVDKDRHENRRITPSGRDVRRGNGKKEKDSDRSGGSNKSNSKERTAVRMRTV